MIFIHLFAAAVAHLVPLDWGFARFRRSEAGAHFNSRPSTALSPSVFTFNSISVLNSKESKATPEMQAYSMSKSSGVINIFRSHVIEPKYKVLLHGYRATLHLRQVHTNAQLRDHLHCQIRQLFPNNKRSPRLSSGRYNRCYAFPPPSKDEQDKNYQDKDGRDQQLQANTQPAVVWLSTSIGFYGVMTAGSVFLGRKYGLLDQFLHTPIKLESTLPYMGVMAGLFVISTLLSEVLPSFKELKTLYQRTLIPQLKLIPLFGLALMAAGAGIGEEALFRGVLQNWVMEQVGTTYLADFSVVLGVLASSFAFGLAHAITASYFIFAFAAGIVFGIEYLNCGLPAAAFTHGLYDLIAFIVVIQLWGNNTDKNNEIKNEKI